MLLVAMSILFISIHHPMVNTLDLAPFLIIIILILPLFGGIS